MRAALVGAALLVVGGVAADRWIAATPLPPLAAPMSTLVTDRNGDPLRVFLAADDRWRLPVALGTVDQGYLDMLIAYEEFPGMVRRNMHGNKGYKELRSKHPRQIVICDWHYWDSGEFPTARAFAELGYPVLGSTRERADNIAAFSRYIAGMGGEGMIATLWSLQNQADPALVDEVIARSGRAFWSPDSATR